MKSVAIIPARAGSKRIPHKNTLAVLGKPMIEYPITAAFKAGIFDRIVVYSDCSTVLSVARRCGADTSVARHGSCASDSTSFAESILNCLRAMGDMEAVHVCAIYATAVTLRESSLVESQKILLKGDVSAVLAITPYETPPGRVMHYRDGWLRFLHAENAGARSQDLDRGFRDAAQFIWFESKRALAQGNLMGEKLTGFEIPSDEAVDVDYPADLRLARIKLQAMQENNVE